MFLRSLLLGDKNQLVTKPRPASLPNKQGQPARRCIVASSAEPVRSIQYRFAEHSDTFQKIDEVIQKDLPALRKDGVI